MPDVLAHYSMSFILLYRFVGLRRAVFLAVVGVLPDFDALLGVHRWVTHSLLVFLLFFTVGWIVVGRLRSGLLGVYGLLGVVYVLHIVADLFTGFTPVFWPFGMSYYVVPDVGARVGWGVLGFVSGVRVVGVETGFRFGGVVDGPLVSSVGAILGVLAVVLVLLDSNRFSGVRGGL